MFFLQVHSVDTDHPLSPQIAVATEQFNTDSGLGPKFSERRGVLHLFRSISHSSLPIPNSRSSLIFIVAVPNYLSFVDFIRFSGSSIGHVCEFLLIRKDEMENRQSVLTKLLDQCAADGFSCNFNMEKFSPREVCRFCWQKEEKPTHFVCGTSENLWVCVICGFVGCGKNLKKIQEIWRNKVKEAEEREAFKR